MYEGSVTVVRCVVGIDRGVKVEVGLHQGWALSPFLFEVVIDRLMDKIRQESLWTMMLEEDMVVCGERREQVESGEEEVCTGEKRNESQ